MADHYDVVVLGSGPGGYVAAIRAAQLGLRTATVERENLGGICLNWGCIPTKALLRTAEIFHYLQHADAYGLSNEKPSFDIAKVVARSRAVAKQLNQGVAHLMKKNKINVVMGEGKLTAKNKLVVTGADKKTAELEAKHIILATGARARDLPFAKADGKRIWTYRHAMTPPESRASRPTRRASSRRSRPPTANPPNSTSVTASSRSASCRIPRTSASKRSALRPRRATSTSTNTAAPACPASGRSATSRARPGLRTRPATKASPPPKPSPRSSATRTSTRTTPTPRTSPAAPTAVRRSPASASAKPRQRRRGTR